jgi:hypothetical protein
MTIETITSQYEFSHGRAPKGRGLWAIKVSGSAGTQVYFIFGTVQESRKEAVRRYKAEFRTNKVNYVTILP